MKEKNILTEIKKFQLKTTKCLFTEKGLKNERNISNTQQTIIEYMLENKDKDIYQNDLEKDLNLSRATVSSVLKTMERNKMVKRTVSKKDTRTRKIVLMDYAITAYNKSKENRNDIIDIATKNVKKEDIDTFKDVLEKMNANLEEYIRR